MITGVADTHTAIWYLYADLRLSTLAKQFIDNAAAHGQKIAVSSISLAELIYLMEKGRIPPAGYSDLIDVLNDPESVFEEIPLTQQIVNSMHRIPREDVPDLPDRIVAATGMHLNVPVISRDGRIRASSVLTIW